MVSTCVIVEAYYFKYISHIHNFMSISTCKCFLLWENFAPDHGSSLDVQISHWLSTPSPRPPSPTIHKKLTYNARMCLCIVPIESERLRCVFYGTCSMRHTQWQLMCMCNKGQSVRHQSCSPCDALHVIYSSVYSTCTFSNTFACECFILYNPSLYTSTL